MNPTEPGSNKPMKSKKMMASQNSRSNLGVPAMMPDDFANTYSDSKANNSALIPPRPIKKFHTSNPMQLQVQTK